MPVAGPQRRPGSSSLTADAAFVSRDSLLEHIEAGVLTMDRQLTVLSWNPGAERLYGYSAAEVVGHPAREYGVFAGDPSRPPRTGS